MLLFDAAQRRESRRQADAVEAVATGYSSTKSEKGLRLLEQLLHALRSN